MANRTTPARLLKTLPDADTPRTLPADENAIALSVGPSTCVDTKDAVDATLLVRVGSVEIEVEVTLCPDPSQGKVARRHPLGVWGSLDNWASDNLVRAIEDADEDFDRHDLISEIEWEVRNAAA